MKSLRLQLCRFFGLLGLLLGLSANAQSFKLGLTASAPDVVLGESLTYNLAVTNISGQLLTNVLVTDFAPATASLFSASNSFGGITNVLPGVVVFAVDVLSNNAWAVMSLTVVPTVPGTLTNFVTVTASNTLPATALMTTPVFLAFSDLTLTLTGPSTQVLTNDQVTFVLSVTNRGPDSIAGVVLSNQLPADFIVLSVGPTNQVFTNNSLIFNVGTMAANTFAQFQVRGQPTNAGPHVFSATVSSPFLLDPFPTNETVSASIDVTTNLPADLTVSLISTQAFNPRTGLVQQKALLTNAGTNAIPSARITVAGLTNWLFNAAGTNSGLPFITHGGTLAPGESTELWLKYFIPSKSPGGNPTNLTAAAVPFFKSFGPAGTVVPISRVLPLASGEVLVEFPSVLGRSYTVVYFEGGSFTNTYVVQPRIVAPGNKVQWYDDGPPATLKPPSQTGARFFKVLEN